MGILPAILWMEREFMKLTTSFVIAFAPFAVVQAAEQTLTELSCSDFRPTEEALERYQDLRGACEGIVDRDGELYAKFAATVRRVSAGGRTIHFYLPATNHTFTVKPDPQSRVWIGNRKVSARDLHPGQKIRIYLAVNAMARPDIDEIAFITDDNLIVRHRAESGDPVEKPARVTTTVVKTQAIVESFDPETRELKLINSAGERYTIIADERVGSLGSLQARDRIAIEYLESVALVVSPAGFDSTNSRTEVLAVSADDEHPALVASDTTVIVATIEAFDAEERWATVRLSDGSSQTIQVSEDAPLEMINVGDQVHFQITRATAISVEESD